MHNKALLPDNLPGESGVSFQGNKMDPLTITASFATIVGLMSAFKTEKETSKGNEYEEFLSWLNEKKHKEIISLLESNAKTAISIKAFLHQDREAIISTFQRIEDVLVLLSSQINGVSDIASSLYPGEELSDQSIDILKQFIESNGSKFIMAKSMSIGPRLIVLDGDVQSIEYHDVRFLDDDLAILVELGLLRLDYNSSGEELYIMTRNSIKYISTVGT